MYIFFFNILVVKILLIGRNFSKESFRGKGKKREKKTLVLTDLIFIFIVDIYLMLDEFLVIHVGSGVIHALCL